MRNKHNIFVWNNSAITNSLINHLVKSPFVNKVFYANNRSINLNNNAFLLINDGKKMLKEMQDNNIQYVFSNSEANDKAFIDICRKEGFTSIGCNYKDMKLESSKSYCKSLMNKHGIKTAQYKVITEKEQLKDALKEIGLPCFMKADGYAKSLSAIMISTEEQYYNTANTYLDGHFGTASEKIIIEKNITGIEASLPLVLDGKNIKILRPIRDYKRRNNNDEGPNTGSMGSICPLVLNEEHIQLINSLIKKIEIMLNSENHLYKGFMTINVIISDNEIYLLEINTRLGDSEGQTIFNLLETDIFEIFQAIEQEKLNNLDIKFKTGYSMSVNIINKNYPDIRSLEKARISKQSIKELNESILDIAFYNKIKQDADYYYQIYDRFISITGYNSDVNTLQTNIYNNIKLINGENIFYRTDIGDDFVVKL